MQEIKGTHLGKVFLAHLIMAGLVIFTADALGGFEAALLTAMVWLTAILATVAAGVENVISQELEKLHQNLKGYLLDMYAEMIDKK